MRGPLRLLAGVWLLLSCARITCAVPPKVVSTAVAIKDAEAGSARVSLAEYTITADQDLLDCPGIASCPPLDPCPPCNYANHNECARIMNPIGQPDEACLLLCNSAYCDPDIYGVWEEMAFPRSNVTADLSDEDAYPYAIAQFRFYVPQGQPYCNSSITLRCSGPGNSIFTNPDLMITKTPLDSIFEVYSYDRTPWVTARLTYDRITICPSDNSAIFTENYAAGTFFVYDFIGSGLSYISLETNTLPPLSSPPDMSWCNGAILPAPFNGGTAEPLTNGLVNASSTTYKCLASDVGYQYELTDQFSIDMIARIDGPCPRYFGITQLDSQSFVDRRMLLSFTEPFATTELAVQRGQPDILMDLDFAPRFIALTFCPNDTSLPTYLTVRIEGDGPFRVFSSSNPSSFVATPQANLGPPMQISTATGLAKTLVVPTSVGTRRTCFEGCYFLSYNCSCQGGLSSPENRVEATALWPVPQGWYAELLGTVDIQRPAWLGAQPFAGPRVLQTTFMFSKRSIRDGNEFSLPLFSDAEVASSYFMFTGQLSLVNSLKEGFASDVFRPQPLVPTVRSDPSNCTVGAYREIKQLIESYLSQIQNSSADLLDITYQLDVLNLRSSYIACGNQASALLSTQSSQRVIETAQCLTFSDSDPCCNERVEWRQCCVPRLLPTTTVVSSPDESAISDSCPATTPACLSTYLDEFTAAKEVTCGTTLPLPNTWNFEQCVDKWVICSDRVFGYSLMGDECVTDADCPSGFCNAPYTPYISRIPLRSLTSPRGQRRVCQEPLASLTTRFLTCLAEEGSAVMLEILRDYPAATLNASILALQTALQANDCVAPAGVAIGAGYVQHYWDGRASLCQQTCEYYAMGPFVQATLDCNLGSDSNTICGSRMRWTVERNLAACAAVATCNWYDCVSNFLNATECNSTCLASPGVCSICRNDGTCFEDFAKYDASVVDASACAAAHACQLANGTIVNLDPASCAATFSCSSPCWDESQKAYRPCLTQAECQQAGKCSDDSLNNPFTTEYARSMHAPPNCPSDGACVFPPRPFFAALCGSLYESYTYVVSDTIGCVVWDVNQTNCVASGGEFVPRAHSEAQCTTKCGCLKDYSYISTYLTEKIASTYPSTAAECAICSPEQPCAPYFEWTPAKWGAGSPRTLTWQTPALIPAYQLRSDAFDFRTFASLWDDTCSQTGPLWRARTLTYSQCRFNRVASSLEAVACACGTDGSTACVDSVESSLPIGVGEPCPLVPQTLNIPPHTIEFAASSVSPSQGCTPMVAFLVPQSTFANVAPRQKLSSYFAHSRSDPKRGEFINSHGAVVGEVIGDGVKLEFNGSFSSVRLCLDLGSFATRYPSLNVKEFPLVDIAESNSSGVYPLNLLMDIESDGFCGTVAVVRGTVYVPVLHKNKWESAQPVGLSRGEKAALSVCAALYLISVLYAPYYCMALIRALGFVPSLTISIFWLPVLLSIANALRGIYFALLASEVVKDQTFVDVLLVELPTFVWFTASSLMVIFWIVFLASLWTEKSLARVRRLKRGFWIVFATANAVMYCVFIVFVVVFSTLEERVERQRCRGRLSAELIRRPKRIAFIVYQSVLAFIGLVFAIANLVAGPLMARRLRKAVEKPDAKAKFKLVIVGVICAVGFALHAIFILILALVDPGIPYLALVLLALDLSATAILLWQVPSPTQLKKSMSDNVTGSGSGLSRRQATSDL